MLAIGVELLLAKRRIDWVHYPKAFEKRLSAARPTSYAWPAYRHWNGDRKTFLSKCKLSPSADSLNSWVQMRMRIRPRPLKGAPS
jgi:hypothetical protein